MPSPSKIPRPKPVTKKYCKENVAETKRPAATQNKTKNVDMSKDSKKLHKPEVKTFVKNTAMIKQKKSPLRVVQENKFRLQEKKENHPIAKTTFHDRRGISEIKRSEQNLRTALDSMEQDVEALTSDLKSVKQELQKSKNDAFDLRKKEQNLEMIVEDLENQNTRQAEILETFYRDPVTMTRIDPTHEFESLLKTEQQKQSCAVTDIKHCLADVKLSLKNLDTELHALNFVHEESLLL